MNIKKIKQIYEKKDQGLYGTVKIKDLLGMLYHENSKLDRFTSRELGQAVGLFSDPYITTRSTRPHKRYLSKERYAFDESVLESESDAFFELVKSRRSVRKYNPDYKVSLNELSYILHYGYGVTLKESINQDGGYMGYRNVPSAGGLYPLEIYVCLFNSHLKEGLYHYDDLESSLVLTKQGNHLETVKDLIQAEPWVDMSSASGVILITGMIERHAIKYGERGYRFMLQECGAASYLLSLIIEKVGLGSCMVGGFLDQEVNKFLEVDGNYETILNPIVFGKKEG